MSRRHERGSAIVEFHFLGLLLLVPMVYVLLTVLDVQRSAYGVTQAAREAGRMYVATGDESAARAAAGVALMDQGVDPGSVAITLSCSAYPCYQAGAEITITVSGNVDLPLVPDVLVGTANARIPVHATHVAVVDHYRELG
ncbi:pilus assembly protein [Phytoactinopolyspora alkaliphila]|uniref:Pilus assembly protein n=1 Tax=Phytoactinopolyspora alkaliphila TaxID=1783498 RepID=A0A6N9YLX7_9ACTN|nr:pilus assembly protein [Phytoactinopolyspora alkaliphila]NED96071.1 pilus assembly protein [Phytoactinopolyspora alkaliphila]